MINENSVVTRHSIKLNVRLDKLLAYRRDGEGLSSRITAICDRFEAIYASNCSRVRDLVNQPDFHQLVEACGNARTQAGWLSAYIEKLPSGEPQRNRLTTLSASDIVVLEELLARHTASDARPVSTMRPSSSALK